MYAEWFKRFHSYQSYVLYPLNSIEMTVDDGSNTVDSSGAICMCIQLSDLDWSTLTTGIVDYLIRYVLRFMYVSSIDNQLHQYLVLGMDEVSQGLKNVRRDNV